MAIFLSKNPYKGINAHFQSFLQSSEGGWTTFHTDHITHLKSAINRSLPAGYYALTERSLQIQMPDETIYPTRPDVVAVFEVSASLQAAKTSTPTREIPITLPEDDLGAVEIYHAATNRFVTRLELLSPTNKTQHLRIYMDMRQAMLKLGVNMIEVDYLHETPSIFRDILPDYTKNAEGAYPYCISITNPYHEKLSLYCFHLEDSIPVLTIPLKGEESFTLDFGAGYNYTFEDDRRAHMLIDYEQLPINFESYSPADRAKIRAVMDTTTKNP